MSKSDLKERINGLSAQQLLLLAKQIGLENKTATGAQNNSTQSIAAYFVADEPIGVNDLRESLKDRLPEYMIPSKFIQLDELPHLPNGKIDVKSLRPPAEEASSSAQTEVPSPMSEVEKQLAEIWEEVLGFHHIGVHDNFFEIGGDSILSIQIVAKARHKGIFLSPNQLFENQTISELARHAKTEKRDNVEEVITGNVPLLPIQHWFFEEHKNAPHYWNQAILFDVPENLDIDILKKSIKNLIEYHDALRLDFAKTQEGWNSFIAKVEKIDPFTVVDLAGSSIVETDKMIEAESVKLQANLKLERSALFQTILFKCGEGKNKLLLVAHHLLVDVVSWQILVSDLESIYDKLARNEQFNLPVKATTYAKWSNHLDELSTSGAFDNEIKFWKDQSQSDKLPADFDTPLPIEERTITTSILKIDTTATENLLRNSNEAYHTRTEELLIAALMMSLKKWRGITKLCLGMEKHGRNYAKMDLSNTVGWFTTYFPVTLKIEDDNDFRTGILAIKEKLRSVPNDGIGYGALRYLKKVGGLSQRPSAIFNYLGNQKPYDSKILGNGRFLSKGLRAENSERYHLLELNAFIGDGQLNLHLSYSDQFYKQESIYSLIELFKTTLLEVIEHCSARETGEYSPSDFPEAGLNQSDLDNLFNQIN